MFTGSAQCLKGKARIEPGTVNGRICQRGETSAFYASGNFPQVGPFGKSGHSHWAHGIRSTPQTKPRAELVSLISELLPEAGAQSGV